MNFFSFLRIFSISVIMRNRTRQSINSVLQFPVNKKMHCICLLDTETTASICWRVLHMEAISFIHFVFLFFLEVTEKSKTV